MKVLCLHISDLFQIYETTLFFTGGAKTDFDARWKNFHIVKSALQDKVRNRSKIMPNKGQKLGIGALLAVLLHRLIIELNRLSQLSCYLLA